MKKEYNDCHYDDLQKLYDEAKKLSDGDADALLDCMFLFLTDNGFKLRFESLIKDNRGFPIGKVEISDVLAIYSSMKPEVSFGSLE